MFELPPAGGAQVIVDLDSLPDSGLTLNIQWLYGYYFVNDQIAFRYEGNGSVSMAHQNKFSNFSIRRVFLTLIKGLKELELNPMTLTFSGANRPLEKAFIDFYFKEKVLQIRVAFVIGTLLYSLFGVLDAVLLDDLKYTFWFIRFGIVLPVSVLCFAFTYSALFKTMNQPLIAANNMIGGIGIIAMVVLAGPPASYLYYAGLILVFIYVYTFSGLRFIWANGTCWCIVVIFEILAVFLKDIPGFILISNTFFFVAANILSMFAAYFIEYSLRRAFYLTKLLEEEKEKVDHTKNHLERLVKERTLQLSEANEDLREELVNKRKLLDQQKKLQEQLVQSHKMEAIGTLAGGIAHDFNNILSGILGYSELAEMHIDTPVVARDNIAQITKGAKRAAGLIQQILTFSRQTEHEKHLLNVSLIVKEALKLLRSSIPSTIEIRENIFSDATVLADPTQIHQVVINLCTNAYHAMRVGGGILTVELGEIEIFDQNRVQDLDMLPGKYLKLEVSDTGQGMDEEILGKIFDPYFSTKEVGEGTGLGLALVYGIVEKHAGYVRVYSAPGRGSTFHIFFPVTDKKVVSADPANDIKPLNGGTERIMVVDDEESILIVTRDLLEDYGYKVSVFENGESACEEFVKTPDQFDLIITDMTMPQMTGDEFSARALKIRKDIPIILCTGYNENMSEDKAYGLGIKKFVQKPIDSQYLIFLIRELLDKEQQ